MEQQPEHAVVAEGDMQHLRDVRSELRSRGVQAEMIAPPSGCGSG